MHEQLKTPTSFKVNSVQPSPPAPTLPHFLWRNKQYKTTERKFYSFSNKYSAQNKIHSYLNQAAVPGIQLGIQLTVVTCSTVLWLLTVLQGCTTS